MRDLPFIAGLAQAGATLNAWLEIKACVKLRC